jgi:uncharacterized membrane protein YoaT (DUF817 family)
MERHRKPWSHLGQAPAAFSLQIVAIVLLRRENALLLAVMLAESLAILCLWHELADVICLLSIGVLGSVAEVIFVRSGVWQYANPSLLGIPIWFPVAFGTSALLGMQFVRAIAALWANARRG